MQAHESRARSLIKGLTWRVVATMTTIVIAYAVVGDMTIALEIGLIEVFAKIAVYYAHERAWQQVGLGITEPDETRIA